MPDDMILVEGLYEINRALKQSGPLVQKAALKGLREAAEPVRQDAQRLAQVQISGLGKRAKKRPAPWSKVRVGQNFHEVYLAPKERGVKSKTDPRRRRPAFATIMLGKAYEPALHRDQALIRGKVDAWLSRVMEGI